MSSREQVFNDGEAYERSMGRWSRIIGVKFLDWLALSKNLEIIDVGCGNGAFTEVLLDRCQPKSVMAIDPSEGQLVYARAHAGSRAVQYGIGDAQAIPFEAARFDAATMALVIAFVPDPALAVREMARVTRPGGLVATYMWDFEKGGVPSSPIARQMKRMGILPPAPYNQHSAKAETLVQMWSDAGLADIEATALTIMAKFASFDEFWSSFETGGATAKMLAGLSPQVRDELRAAVREALPTQADGRIEIEARANAVKGRKPA